MRDLGGCGTPGPPKIPENPENPKTPVFTAPEPLQEQLQRPNFLVWSLRDFGNTLLTGPENPETAKATVFIAPEQLREQLKRLNFLVWSLRGFGNTLLTGPESLRSFENTQLTGSKPLWRIKPSANMSSNTAHLPRSSAPHAPCMYMHGFTLVYIPLYIYV